MSGLGAVVVVQEAAPSEELEALLGSQRAAALQAELDRRAAEIADELASKSVQTASAGASLPDLVEALLAPGEGPVLVIWPRLPRLRSEHVQEAVGDLQAGCDLVFGPLVDGGFYLLGLARPAPNMLALLQEGFETMPGTPGALAAAAESGLEIGYLRPERALRTDSDVQAALADPLTPPEIRGLLAS